MSYVYTYTMCVCFWELGYPKHPLKPLLFAHFESLGSAFSVGTSALMDLHGIGSAANNHSITHLYSYIYIYTYIYIHIYIYIHNTIFHKPNLWLTTSSDLCYMISTYIYIYFGYLMLYLPLRWVAYPTPRCPWTTPLGLPGLLIPGFFTVFFGLFLLKIPEQRMWPNSGQLRTTPLSFS